MNKASSPSPTCLLPKSLRRGKAPPGSQSTLAPQVTAESDTTSTTEVRKCSLDRGTGSTGRPQSQGQPCPPPPWLQLLGDLNETKKQRNVQCPYSLGKCKPKSLWDSTFFLSEWLRSKAQSTAHSGEDVEQSKHSSIAGGSSSLYSHMGNQLGSCSENWI